MPSEVGVNPKSRGELAAENIIRREGGFVNIAADRGGPTNFGITLKTLGEERGAVVTVADVQALTKEEAIAIYRRRYILPFEAIAWDPLFALVVDTAVNNGRGRAAQWLQRAVGAVEDGVIGPKTLAKVEVNPAATFCRLFSVRMKAYGALVAQNHSQVVFIAGWLNRLSEFMEMYATLMETR